MNLYCFKCSTLTKYHHFKIKHKIDEKTNTFCRFIDYGFKV